MDAPISQLINLTGKSAIVTGGAKGIGAAICSRLAEAGAKVLVADIDADEAASTASSLNAKGYTASPFAADVASTDDVEAMVAKCESEFGSVDILVNNAGIYPSRPLAAMSIADFDRVLGVNLRGVFLATKFASEAMKRGGHGGKIINITSIDALHPSMIGLAHYDASKHGVWGFTKNVALELAAHAITVNAIAPGGILTPGVGAMQGAGATLTAAQVKASTEAFLAKIPLHRLGDPDEIGKVALFLASDLASYLTGSQIVVDGGALLS
jgi:2-deoxy-D-gluconate 3-dehydrogenase